MLNDTERRRVNQRVPSQLLEATVLSPALDDDGMLRVEIDATGAVEACPWPDFAVAPPVPGDAAAVMESDHGNYWVLGVWANG